MPRTVEYFLTMASPWAYLGHAAFMEIARRHRLDVRYRPMPVRRVFDATGGLPLPQRHPARQRYRLVELQRWRERRGLALNPQPVLFLKLVPPVARNPDMQCGARLFGTLHWSRTRGH